MQFPCSPSIKFEEMADICRFFGVQHHLVKVVTGSFGAVLLTITGGIPLFLEGALSSRECRRRKKSIWDFQIVIEGRDQPE